MNSPPSPTISEISATALASRGFQRLPAAEDDKVSAASFEMTVEPLSASDLHGDAEQLRKPRYGSTELRRVLGERHVNMIAFSCTVGIGCFLQAGKCMNLIGPGGAVMAYVIMGTILWSSMASLGEMTALFPVKGPIIDFPCRFLDEGVGFATGWMAWCAYCILIGTEISAVSQLFGFTFTPEYLKEFNYPEPTLGWRFGTETNPNVWVAIFLIFVLLINLMPVRIYGEMEYVFGTFKILVMTGLILFNVIINVKNTHDGRSPGQFATYQAPYGFFSSNVTIISETGTTAHVFTGDTGRLVGLWSAMNTIFFSLQGFFTVSITAAENKHLDRDEGIKLATRKISLRVIMLYSLLVFTVGLVVPYTDYNLRDSSISSIRKGQNSPFMLALVHSGVRGWPNFLNAFFIFSAFSTAINGLYIASRLLHALASIRNVWPETSWAYSIKTRLERTTAHGVPMAAVFVSWLFGLLGFLGGQPSPARLLGRMATFSTANMIIVYGVICLSFLVFKSWTIEGDPTEEVVVVTPHGVVLNRNASDYPYKSHLQWGRALYGLVGCTLLLVFNGWRSFLKPFSTPDFLASYFNIFIFLVIVSAYHIKDEREWNPLRWTRRVTMDIRNPTVTREKNFKLRKGRLHRANQEKFFCRENGVKFLQFIWAWVK